MINKIPKEKCKDHNAVSRTNFCLDTNINV